MSKTTDERINKSEANHTRNVIAKVSYAESPALKAKVKAAVNKKYPFLQLNK